MGKFDGFYVIFFIFLGTLRECYDELGNRYQIPLYCLASPVNLVEDQSEETSSIGGGGTRTVNEDSATASFAHGISTSTATMSGDCFMLKFRVVAHIRDG